MSQEFHGHSQAWVYFSYLSFIAACLLVGGAIFFIPIDIWIRAYLLIGMVMLVQSAVNVTKTLRDNHESARLINRLEDAKTEQLLRDTAAVPPAKL